jgi:MarR family transcriptional regulator, organic hydroperoxide resistance regulator
MMQNVDFIGSISYSLNKVSTFYYSELEKSLSSVGLHYGQIYVLISLWGKDNQTQKEIAEGISVSPPTVNKMVKSLERNNFISSVRCANDSRAVRINLTEKGQVIREQVEIIWNELEAKICSELTDTEKLIFKQILQKMNKLTA